MEAIRPAIATAEPAPAWRQWLERPGIPEILLSLLTLLVYARSLTLGYVYDDRSTIDGLGNLSWSDVPRLFTQNVIQNHSSNFYRPILLLWLGVMHMLAGTNPVGWHLSEVLLHTVCVLLVFRLACHLLQDRFAATLAAAFFALHPAHVEAVSWVSDSADLLLTIALLLSALALIRWLTGGNPLWWATCLLLATACCFIKETGVVFSALLLVLAFGIKGKVSRPAILLTAGAALACACTYLILRSQILHGFAHPLSKANDPQMALTLPAAICFYLSHLVFPVSLDMFYPLSFVGEWKSTDFLMPLLALAAVVAGLIWLYRKLADRRLFWFCLVWTSAPLLPPLYIKLFPAFELVHDRYLYIPSIALAVALAAAVKHVLASPPRWLPRYAVACAVAVLLTAAGAETISYQGAWKDDSTFYRRALLFTPRNDRVLVNLGVTDLQEGKMGEGMDLLKRALEIKPDNAFALYDLGNAAWNSNDLPAAESYFQQAVDLEAHANWWVMLADAKYRLGKLAETEMAAQRAIALNSSEPGAHLLLGAALLDGGNPAAAASEFNLELSYHPGEASAQQALQIAEQKLGGRID